MENTYTANIPDDLQNIAKNIIEKYIDSRIFFLKGNLGAGKTTFVKYFAKVLGVKDNITSPTFAIINVYETKDNTSIYHFDLYRIKQLDELYEIGFEDYLLSGNYCFIEWPDIIEDFLDDVVVITIEVNGDKRIIKTKKYESFSNRFRE